MERNVSISSGTLICRALRARGHRAVLVDMFYGLEGMDVPIETLFDDLPPLADAHVAEAEPDLDAVRASRVWKSPSKIGKGVLELCQLADVVFLGLHGACGEDGRIQAALDLLGVPYTGSGYLASALAMDKNLTKELIAPLGVRTPKWEIAEYSPADAADIAARTKLPCVVKPVDSGSSIGVSIAYTAQELEKALRENAKLGRVMLEEYVKGREIDVAVLEDRALPPIEIIPKVGFYDYKNKYQAGATVEICPCDLDGETQRRLCEAASGEVYFLEINTLPGMTPTSLLPQEAAAAGIDYEALCQRLADLALEGRR